MKKTLALLLTFALLLLVGCNQSQEESTSAPDEECIVRIAGMTGPTSIGMVGVMEKNANGQSLNKYSFTVTGSPDEITTKLARKELDIAAVPANLASVLYNNTDGEICMLAVNNLGVLYIVTKGESISSVEDLKGKTIYTTGMGTTPEYALRHILAGNNINPDSDVNIVFKSEASEVVQEAVKSDKIIAMLPQPQVTVAMGKTEGLEIALDLNKEWQKLDSEGTIVTGVLVVRKSFAQEHPQVIKNFLQEYKQSADEVNQSPSQTALLVAKHGIFENSAVIEKALPYCNIKCITGAEMKTCVNKYLGVLYEQAPKSVGGKLPEEDFFYICE